MTRNSQNGFQIWDYGTRQQVNKTRPLAIFISTKEIFISTKEMNRNESARPCGRADGDVCNTSLR
jgi:hypothetical protein